MCMARLKGVRQHQRGARRKMHSDAAARKERLRLDWKKTRRQLLGSARIKRWRAKQPKKAKGRSVNIVLGSLEDLRPATSSRSTMTSGQRTKHPARSRTRPASAAVGAPLAPRPLLASDS